MTYFSTEECRLHYADVMSCVEMAQEQGKVELAGRLKHFASKLQGIEVFSINDPHSESLDAEAKRHARENKIPYRDALLKVAGRLS